MHIGLLTYQTGHLKTWQLARIFLTKGFRVTIYGFPFSYRPSKPSQRFQDRPNALIPLDIEDFCTRYGVRYVRVGGWGDEFAGALGKSGEPDTPDVFLHCIAKIVPAAFIAGRTIVNAHPGLLPQNRGVDAFKWSLVNGWPFGVTLHVIDAEIDRGTILRRMRVPVFANDTLEDVWRRSYDIEIDLMSNIDIHLANLRHNWFVGDDHDCSHKLIPLETDKVIEQMFEDRKAEMMRLSTDLTASAHVSDKTAG